MAVAVAATGLTKRKSLVSSSETEVRGVGWNEAGPSDVR